MKNFQRGVQQLDLIFHVGFSISLSIDVIFQISNVYFANFSFLCEYKETPYFLPLLNKIQYKNRLIYKYAIIITRIQIIYKIINIFRFHHNLIFSFEKSRPLKNNLTTLRIDPQYYTVPQRLIFIKHCMEFPGLNSCLMSDFQDWCPPWYQNPSILLVRNSVSVYEHGVRCRRAQRSGAVAHRLLM